MAEQVFFTADTHFFHRLATKLRNFASIEEMNETLVERWNSVVSCGDRVYHLGDVSLGKPEETADLLARLNGQIYLVRGNHDSTAENGKCKGRFVWQKDLFYLDIGGQKIMLCHYAMRTWRNAYRGTWMLYGHSHGSLPESETSRSFDVGVDPWNLTPISFEQVAEKMATKSFVPIDHHGIAPAWGPPED
jgi:calcineurin-like phosphoesterase family protein